MSKTKLIINFIKRKKKKYYNSIIFLNHSHEINKNYLSLDVEDNLFNSTKEKIVLDLGLVPTDILSNTLNFKIKIFYGINKAYCFLSEDNPNELLIEYNSLENHKIIYDNNELLTEYDGNNLVKRIIFINAPSTIKISQTLVSFFSEVCPYIKENSNSLEVIDYNLSKRIFGVKIIEKYDELNINKTIVQQKDKLLDLYSNLKALVNRNITDKAIYKNLFEEYKIEEIDINFSQKRTLLEDEFKNPDDYFTMFLYFIWYSIKNSHLKDNFDGKISIIDIFNNFNELYNLYLNDKDLLIYQKIMLFCSHACFFLDNNDIEKYKSAKLKYIKKKDILNNTIYGLSFNFLTNFVSKLNEKSYLFFPLLMLDCGSYHFQNNKEIYGYNRESCDVIKAHINELIPEVFFEYNEETDILKKENGFNYKGYGIIFLNRLAILDKYKIDLAKDTYKNNKEKRLFKHFAMLTAKIIMHESFGHNKMIFNQKKRLASPSRFFNRNKKLVVMVPYTFTKEDEKDAEYFKSLNKQLTGERGKFLEYFFGEYNKRLIIDLIFKIGYIGKLLDNVDYFVKENLEDLQKYIINKYKITNYASIKYDDNDLSFEEENKKMEQIINNYEEKNKKGEKEENKFEQNEKKNDENQNVFITKKNILFIEEDDFEDKEEDSNENQKDSLPFFRALHIS